MLSEFGRIGRDAELRFTSQGTAVCGVPVAYNYGQKGQDGNRPTQWVEVTVWGKQAEGLAQYLTKGKQIYFTVRDVRVETFQKQDGSQGFKLIGNLVDLKFASDNNPQQQQQQQQLMGNQYGNQQARPEPDYDNFEDNIPF